MSDIGALRNAVADAREKSYAAQRKAQARAADGILENEGEDEVGNTSKALAAAELALQTALKAEDAARAALKAKSAGGRRRKSRKTRRRRHGRKTRRARK